MRAIAKKTAAVCLALCVVLVCGAVTAGAEVRLDGSGVVTVELNSCRAGEWYSLLVVKGTAGNYSLEESAILYADQLQANEEGRMSVTFIHADLPKCLFLAGGEFTDGEASPRVIGAYTPDEPAATLPVELIAIEEEAFMDCPFEAVVIGERVESIGARAFKDCPALSRIVIPENVTEIAADAFAGCGPITVVCRENSAAYSFAQAQGMTIELISD